MGTLKPAMSLRAGTLTKHLQLDKNFADSVDSGATLSADEEVSVKDDDARCAIIIVVMIVVVVVVVVTALHGMQTRSSNENSVRLSVCPSVYVCQTQFQSSTFGQKLMHPAHNALHQPFFFSEN